MRLRSIELEMPDRNAAVRFLKETWGLLDAGSGNGTSYLRGTADIPYVVSVAQAGEPAVAAVTFSGSKPELERIRRSEEHTSELQSPCNLVCRLLLEKKKKNTVRQPRTHTI